MGIDKKFKTVLQIENQLFLQLIHFMTGYK
jgi:hypothetical protein